MLGAGIVGIIIACGLNIREPKAKILVLEKELKSGMRSSGRMIVPLTSISLPNLLAKGLYADQKLVPELLQHDADAAAMYREASYLLEHETAALKMKRELIEVKERLGSLRPSRTVADVLCSYLQ